MTATPEQIMTEARHAAQTESDASVARFTEADVMGACGFANIVISPARGKFITYLKAQGIGGKNYGGGYRISSYALSSQSGGWCQSIDVKENATEAAAEVMRSHGINAYCQSRMD